MCTHRTTKVTVAALLLALDENEFRLPDLKDHPSFPENAPSNSTVRLVLRQLEESGWLERYHPEGRIWTASDQLEERLSP